MPSLGNELVIAPVKLSQLLAVKTCLALLLGTFDRLFNLDQQVSHRFGPTLLIAFLDKDQFPQVMSIAQVMAGIVILKIGGIGIVDTVTLPPGIC